MLALPMTGSLQGLALEVLYYIEDMVPTSKSGSLLKLPKALRPAQAIELFELFYQTKKPDVHSWAVDRGLSVESRANAGPQILLVKYGHELTSDPASIIVLIAIPTPKKRPPSDVAAKLIISTLDSEATSEKPSTVVVKSPICEGLYGQHTVELRVGDALLLEEGEKFCVRGGLGDKESSCHASILCTLHRASSTGCIDNRGLDSIKTQ